MAIRLNTDFTLGSCLFGCAKLTKNTDPDKYSDNSYAVRFDARGYQSLPDGSVGKNVIIFGVNMSSSVNFDNKGKNVLILDKKTNTRIKSYVNSRNSIFN